MKFGGGGMVTDLADTSPDDGGSTFGGGLVEGGAQGQGHAHRRTLHKIMHNHA